MSGGLAGSSFGLTGAAYDAQGELLDASVDASRAGDGDEGPSQKSNSATGAV